jgi:hypothetical protein
LLCADDAFVMAARANPWAATLVTPDEANGMPERTTTR